MESKLEGYLHKFQIEYVEHNHPAVFTVEESKKLKENIPGLHCKTLFLKDNNNNFYLLGMPAEKKLDSKKFREIFSLKKIRFATEEELKKQVNLLPGSVSIFGIIYAEKENVVLVLDKEVWSAKSVGFHPNVNTSTLELKHVDLKKFYDSLSNKKKIIEI